MVSRGNKRRMKVARKTAKIMAGRGCILNLTRRRRRRKRRRKRRRLFSFLFSTLKSSVKQIHFEEYTGQSSVNDPGVALELCKPLHDPGLSRENFTHQGRAHICFCHFCVFFFCRLLYFFKSSAFMTRWPAFTSDIRLEKWRREDNW